MTNEEWARKAIPVLVYYCNANKVLTSGELNQIIGKKGSRTGKGLGKIIAIWKDLAKKYGKEVPTLNAFVVNKQTGLPADGLSEAVKDDYSKMNKAEKVVYVSELRAKARNEKNDWKKILRDLGLEEYHEIPTTDLNNSRKEISKSFKSGGEGPEHKALKEAAYNNPNSIGIEDSILEKEMEYPLLSGDRLDVFFKTDSECIAIEVKSKISDDNDIRRGIFQCVKYTSVLNAENIVYGNAKGCRSILVLGGTLSESNRKIANLLQIQVFENYK